MQLFIVTPIANIKKTHVVKVDNPGLTTIYGLKKLISAKMNIPNIFGIRTMSSSQLENNKYLTDCKIEDMQTLQIVFPFNLKIC